ncbi:DSD1 family PLP-dependent enzyme [Trinickia dinghuensis]|uniref:DSD1 family PLP-dependent enzyme n=1 Tax=Trinickia dinghuensis TaxID=2291023 RepID=A0A3D8JYU4_9BURK|nr:DSD1 family PLP-dependent enzyme [Trinickia dinghuensis]RDU97795.1 DSD1 family PLP-dependent enzyme [Trinickia dinghuensis]
MNSDTLDTLDTLDTPAAIVDISRMERNIATMQKRMDTFGVRFRPHVKTTKCLDVIRAQLRAGARGVTVSTLKEAEACFAAGIVDILYAVGIVPSKLARAMALKRLGCDLKLVVDNLAAAEAIVSYCLDEGDAFEVWIEVDTDGHRAGIEPEQDALLDVARTLHEGGMRVGGVMAHAGSSYELHTPEALRALAEQERARCVRAAERLRESGIDCPTVSVGSTPTALSAANLDGVTEVRAGVYVYFDLVMHNVGVCRLDDLALSVLTTVIGHNPEKGWVFVDAGWMAMSRDRGTSKQARDFQYGLPCAIDGTPIEGHLLIAANQEHGILTATDTKPGSMPESTTSASDETDVTTRFPLGTKLRIFPNHACATGAQFSEYHALAPSGELTVWQRLHGW